MDYGKLREKTVKIEKKELLRTPSGKRRMLAVVIMTSERVELLRAPSEKRRMPPVSGRRGHRGR